MCRSPDHIHLWRHSIKATSEAASPRAPAKMDEDPTEDDTTTDLGTVVRDTFRILFRRHHNALNYPASIIEALSVPSNKGVRNPKQGQHNSKLTVFENSITATLHLWQKIAGKRNYGGKPVSSYRRRNFNLEAWRCWRGSCTRTASMWARSWAARWTGVRRSTTPRTLSRLASISTNPLPKA